MSIQKKRIRAEFEARCAKRDHYVCAMCGSLACDHTVAHHITDRSLMPNGGYVVENGIILCPKCHLKAEVFHQNNGRTWWNGYHPNDLYAQIGSSYEDAYAASLLL